MTSVIVAVLEMTTHAVGPNRPPIQGVPGFFPGGKETGAWNEPLTSSSTKVRNEWSYASSPPVCLHVVERNNFKVYIFYY